jgi:hypothetical protein
LKYAERAHTLFDLRLRQYVPGGAAGGIITTLTIDANPLDSDMSALTFTVSDKVLAALPDFLEVGVEYWDGSVWVESRNGRFLANTQTVDTTDPAGVRSVSGVNLWLWLFGKTSLKGVVPYSESGKSATHDPGITGATSAGSTVTKTAHGFINGDAIVMTGKPAKMATLKPGVVYFVGSATTNTFTVLGSLNGGAKVLGTWSGINFKRVDDKISSVGSLFVNNDLVTFTNVGTSPTLRTDTSYRVVQKDATGFKVSSEVGGAPIDIVDTSGVTTTGLALYRQLNGDRQLAGTPGLILKTIIDEAQARGWGAALTYDFTTTVDSAGVTWGTSQALQFSPGTSGKAVLDRLVEMGACEYSTDGRTLRVWNASHGTDRSTGASPVRVGVAASAVPVKMNLDYLVTDLTVQGEGNLLLDLHSASAPADLGRLEQFESMAGVLDSATATLLGQNSLKLGSTIRRQYTVTETAASATSLPGIDYQSGDWVQARIGDTWTSLRVVELVLSKDSSGVVMVSLVLNSRFIELVARLARKRAAETGGVSVGGNGTTSPGKDTRLPSAPTGVSVQSMVGWNANGAAFDTISGVWSVVTQATDSTAIDVVLYEMWVRADGDAVSVLAASGKGTALSKGPYQPNTTHYVKVRAKSSAGIYGPFTDEVELTTAVVLEPLDPPTAPTVTSKLGTVKVAWDGLLVNSSAVTYSPPPEFEYVWVGMSTTQVGAYTPVGQNLGIAGAATVTGLSLGNVRWFQMYAIDRMGVASPASVAVSVTVVGVKGPDIEANSVTANSIAVGAIQAQHIALGTAMPSGNPMNRVPAPATDVTYWTAVQANLSMPVLLPAAITPTAAGWSIPAATNIESVLLTVRTPAPASGKVWTAIIGGNTNTFGYIAWWTAATGGTATYQPFYSASTILVAPAGATHYAFSIRSTTSAAATTIARFEVFEVLGAGSGQQSAELSPAGLKLVSDDGSGSVDLTTASNNFLSISKWTGLGYESQASIDSDGNGAFQNVVTNNDISVRGAALLGTFESISRNGALDSGAIFDRTARGVVLSGFFTQTDITTTLAYRGLASFSFNVMDTRRYQLQIDSQMVGVNNGTAGTADCEILLSASPIALTATTGYVILRNETWSTSTATKQCIAVVKSFDVGATLSQLQFAVGMNYILIRTRCTTAGSSITLGVGGVPKHTVAILDVGPAFDTFFDLTNNATSGTPVATASSVTTTFACAWSRSWNSNGGAIVSGTGQYTDANMLYQGLGASAMGSMFGWNSLGLSGKTISKVEIYLRNRSTYTGGAVVARLGSSTAGYTVPATHSTANAWTVNWGKGVGAWVTVPAALYANIGNGTIKSFALGISSASSEYAYFDGVGKSDPPRIRVTYK